MKRISILLSLIWTLLAFCLSCKTIPVREVSELEKRYTTIVLRNFSLEGADIQTGGIAKAQAYVEKLPEYFTGFVEKHLRQGRRMRGLFDNIVVEEPGETKTYEGALILEGRFTEFSYTRLKGVASIAAEWELKDAKTNTVVRAFNGRRIVSSPLTGKTPGRCQGFGSDPCVKNLAGDVALSVWESLR